MPFWSLSEVEAEADGGVNVQIDVRRKIENGGNLRGTVHF